MAGEFGNGYATALQNGYFEGMSGDMWAGLQDFNQRSTEAFDQARRRTAEQSRHVGLAVVTTETSIALPDGSTLASASGQAELVVPQLTAEDLNSMLESMIPVGAATRLTRAATRRAPASLAEALTLMEARAGAGMRIMEGKIKDARYANHLLWAKMQHVHRSYDVATKQIYNITVHYWENLQTGVRHGFKFKD